MRWCNLCRYSANGLLLVLLECVNDETPSARISYTCTFRYLQQTHPSHFHQRKNNSRYEREGASRTLYEMDGGNIMVVCGGSEGIALGILNLGTTWRWVVTFMYLLSFPGDRASNSYWIEAGWEHSPFGRHGKRRTRQRRIKIQLCKFSVSSKINMILPFYWR
jgi:hypothetical protein